MSWLAPAWLAALGAVAVPVLIHLLSRGRERRVAVGSTRWLVASGRRRGYRLRPSDGPLLALRCGFLAAVALALAAPRSAWPPPAGGGRVLVAPELARSRARLEATAGGFYERLDAATAAAGARWLVAGLPPVAASPPPAVGAPPADVWSLLAEADRDAAPGAALRLFTLGGSTELAGTRPALARPLVWHDLAGTGAASGDAAPPPGGGETAPLPVVVAADPDRAADAELVAAALAAAAAERRAESRVERLAAALPLPAAPLTVWLSPRAVPAELLDRLAAGGVLLSDGGAGWQPCPGRVESPSAGVWLELRRCSAAETRGGAVLWADGEGRPLLEAERRGAGVWYRLHARFHLHWSDLPSSRALRELLGDLLERARPAAARRAPVASSGAAQRLPRRGRAVDRPPASALPEYLLWGLAGLLLAAERRLVLGREAG